MITIDAVKRIFNKDHYQLMGLSTDEKPTNVDVNTLFLELDTTTFYYFDGTEWQESKGGGVSYEEIPYSELKSAIDNSELKAGGIYRITDYVTKINGTCDLTEDVGQPCYIHYAKSAEHPFDLVVTAADESHLDEHAVAIPHADDTYFANSRLTAWDILYTPENDPTKYSWADPNGNGVIYYMKDEFNNEAGYDFKNVQFLAYALDYTDWEHISTLVTDNNSQFNHYGSPYYVFQALSDYMQSGQYENPFPNGARLDFMVGANILGTIQSPIVDATYLQTYFADWYYTFDYYQNSTHYDISLNPPDCVVCFDNHISNTVDPLAFFLEKEQRPLGLPCNIFEENYTDASNTENIQIFSNYLGTSVAFNIFGGNNFLNIDGYSFGNIIGRLCHHTKIDGCIRIILENYCSYNRFDQRCQDICLGTYCDYNIFSESCTNITFRYANIERVEVDGSVRLLTITNDIQGGGVVGNYHILPGDYRQLTDEIHITQTEPNYQTWVGKDSNNQLQIWVPADLLNLQASIPILYADLVTLRDNQQLKPGAKYRITDYVTKINGMWTIPVSGMTAYVHYARSTETAFDLIVTATSNSTLSESAEALQHGSNSQYGSIVEVKYTLDNDPLNYSWADATNGKGVIYYMRDASNNEAYYDFTSIQFLLYALTASESKYDKFDYSQTGYRYGSIVYILLALQDISTVFPSGLGFSNISNILDLIGAVSTQTIDSTYLATYNADWYYTFDYCGNSQIGNHVLTASYNIHIGPCGDVVNMLLGFVNYGGKPYSYYKYGLPCNVIQTHDLDESIASITFGENCCGNIFTSDVFDITMGKFSVGNLFGSGASRIVTDGTNLANIIAYVLDTHLCERASYIRSYQVDSILEYATVLGYLYSASAIPDVSSYAVAERQIYIGMTTNNNAIVYDPCNIYGGGVTQ